MKRVFLLTWILIFFIPVVHAQEDFFRNEWMPGIFSVPQGAMTYPDSITGETVLITVDPSDTLNKVLPTIFGNNLPAWRRGLLGNTIILPHIRRLSIPVLRIPGGNWSNTWLWDGINHWDGSNRDGYSGTFKDYDDTKNYLDKITSRPVVQWSATTDELLQICSDWGAEPQICVNYALARYIDAPDAVQQAAHYAAEWVRYVKAKGYHVKYWEIGNEHYGSWEAGYVVDGDTITGTRYGADASVFIDSMKAADPEIRIGVTVYPAKDYWSSPNFTPEVLQAVGEKADFLIIHNYFVWAQNPDDITYEQILGALPQIRNNYEALQDLVRTYTSHDSMPTAMTEYNYFGGLKTTEGLATLFFARALGEYISMPYGLVNYWDIQNGSGSDDHGMFTYNEEGAADHTPHPSFFPYYLYREMFGDVLVGSTCDAAGVHAYASAFSNEYKGIVVVNENAAEKTVTLSLPGMITGDTIYRYELSTPELSSRKIYLNGYTSPTGEWYGPRNYGVIPPYVSVAAGDGSFTTGIRAYSVNFFVTRRHIPTGIRSNASTVRNVLLQVRPNPAGTQLTLSWEIPAPAEISFTVYNMRGQMILSLGKEKSAAGRGQRTADVSGLAPGLYLLRMTTPDTVITRKIVIK